jgi:hypothetical protein
LGRLREAQKSLGWVSKGTAYHYIGWSMLLTGRDEEIIAAERYFLVATIEDILWDISANKLPTFDQPTFPSPTNYTTKPAYKVLSLRYQIADSRLHELARFVYELVRSENRWSSLLFQNAELILLESTMLDGTRSLSK